MNVQVIHILKVVKFKNRIVKYYSKILHNDNCSMKLLMKNFKYGRQNQHMFVDIYECDIHQQKAYTLSLELLLIWKGNRNSE